MRPTKEKGSPTAMSPCARGDGGRGRSWTAPGRARAGRPSTPRQRHPGEPSVQTLAGPSGGAPMKATPSPWAQSPAMATQGWGTGRGTAGPPARTMARCESRPSDVMRATRLPSGSSAMVDWPRAQSGPWNSASTAVSATAGPPSGTPAVT